MTNKNELAFPMLTSLVLNSSGARTTAHSSSGMTLRDYFAAKALVSIKFTVRPYDTCDEAARDCYKIADAMLKAREL